MICTSPLTVFFLSYITSNSLEVAFLNDNTLLVAASLSNSDGVSLLKLGVSSKGVKILKQHPSCSI
nr:AAC_HP1_G0006670.mRNA.1.CDS.1 [Saccharomyces cerevisiae]